MILTLHFLSPIRLPALLLVDELSLLLKITLIEALGTPSLDQLDLKVVVIQQIILFLGLLGPLRPLSVGLSILPLLLLLLRLFWVKSQLVDLVPSEAGAYDGGQATHYEDSDQEHADCGQRGKNAVTNAVKEEDKEANGEVEHVQD
eukprot:CAMPEP_0168616726 /NCGR_PEP_ID=MMETSP0449_2-20121227/5172_1 /TAXON_ID=1082188 /ORGANISM="Strombidium rassoulzadegani, Strain ras09" /LENGTH=145 /DNA_ID=CAMNT_0008657513 /DNA_START=410 /DNA_END=847 /DNA_ORIENTATION=+